MTTEPDRPATPDEKKAVFLSYGQAMATTHVLDLNILGAAMGCAMQAGQLPPASIAPFLQKHAGRTLGNLAITLRKHAQLSEDTDRLLREVIATRNHLAHHFFRDNLGRMRTSSGCQQLVAELDEWTKRFIAFSRAFDAETRRSLNVVPSAAALTSILERAESDAEFRKGLEAAHLGPPILQDLLANLRPPE